MLVLNLTKNVQAVKVTNKLTVETRDGRRGTKTVNKVVPGSLRIPVRGKVTVSKEVLSCPDVAAAIANKYIRVTDLKVAAPAVLDTPDAETKKAGTRRRKKK
jgi:hypothetical protein